MFILNADGTTTEAYRGCPYVPFTELNSSQQWAARKRFSPAGRRMGWENIERWAFAVRKDGKLAESPYIVPVSNH